VAAVVLVLCLAFLVKPILAALVVAPLETKQAKALVSLVKDLLVAQVAMAPHTAAVVEVAHLLLVALALLRLVAMVAMV
jgi:hypothetical protein